MFQRSIPLHDESVSLPPSYYVVLRITRIPGGVPLPLRISDLDPVCAVARS